jgi:hypothetical protein
MQNIPVRQDVCTGVFSEATLYEDDGDSLDYQRSRNHSAYHGGDASGRTSVDGDYSVTNATLQQRGSASRETRLGSSEDAASQGMVLGLCYGAVCVGTCRFVCGYANESHSISLAAVQMSADSRSCSLYHIPHRHQLHQQEQTPAVAPMLLMYLSLRRSVPTCPVRVAVGHAHCK